MDPTRFIQSPLFPLLLTSLATQRYSPVTNDDFLTEYDYIIVGAGSAGSTIANRLSELPCASILLLEAGGAPAILSEVPGIGVGASLMGMDWNYTTVPQKHTARAYPNRQIPYFLGKNLGGSSGVNEMLYTRGNRHNYDQWASDFGAEGWSYEDVLPYFKKMEDNKNIDDLAQGFHNTGGPLTVMRPNYQSEIKDLFTEAIRQNYKIIDVNGPAQYGYYDVQASMREGQRCSTAKAYLVPAENRTNLNILKNAFVTKLTMEGRRATGVEFEMKGVKNVVSARKEVILSAGALSTPKLLMLAGIGPGKELNQLEIPVLADLPVGVDYEDHVAIPIFFELGMKIEDFNDKLVNENNVRDYIRFRKGPLASAAAVHYMAFLSDDESDEISDTPQYEVILYEGSIKSVIKGSVSNELYQQVYAPHENKSMLACMPTLIHPKSRGTFRIRSVDPHDPPEIDPNYFESEEDVRDVVQAMKACIKVFETPPLSTKGAKLIDTKFPDCEQFSDDQDAYLGCWTRQFPIESSHPSGTARMGASSNPLSVVDPELRVKSIEGLRIVDCSIMPSIIWGHTNIPTIMIAERAADIIKESIKCK